jgi:hypothetical protein
MLITPTLAQIERIVHGSPAASANVGVSPQAGRFQVRPL